MTFKIITLTWTSFTGLAKTRSALALNASADVDLADLVLPAGILASGLGVGIFSRQSVTGDTFNDGGVNADIEGLLPFGFVFVLVVLNVRPLAKGR